MVGVLIFGLNLSYCHNTHEKKTVLKLLSLGIYVWLVKINFTVFYVIDHGGKKIRDDRVINRIQKVKFLSDSLFVIFSKASNMLFK